MNFQMKKCSLLAERIIDDFYLLILFQNVNPMPTSLSTGSISISGLSLPLKPIFVKMLRDGADDDMVHYFVVLIRYKSRVIATQMISTDTDGVAKLGKLTFPNLINLRELDFDFQVIIISVIMFPL